MKKTNENKVNGVFYTVAQVRDPISNITSYSIVTVEIKDGQVVKTTPMQPDAPAIIFNRIDAILRAGSQTTLEEILNAQKTNA